MSYVYGFGDVGTDPNDPAVQAAVARLRVNYPRLKALLVADANTLMNPGVIDWLGNKAMSVIGKPDQDDSSGQSLLNAVQRFDETMAMVQAGDYSKAATLQVNMEKVVEAWAPSNDRPWSDLMNAIIADLKTLPRTIGEAAGAILRVAGEGAAEGLGTTGVIVGVVILAAGLYVLTQTSITSSITGAFRRKNPRRRK